MLNPLNGKSGKREALKLFNNCTV